MVYIEFSVDGIEFVLLFVLVSWLLLFGGMFVLLISLKLVGCVDGLMVWW